MRTRRQEGRLKRVEDNEKLGAKQRELRRLKWEELRERFGSGGDIVYQYSDKKHVKKLFEYVSYNDVSEFPRDLKPNKVCVDQVRDSILIPYENTHIPFHITMLKNINHQNDDDDKHTLRFVFNSSAAGGLPEFGSNQLIIKELMVTSTDANIPSIVKTIKDMMRKQKMKEEDESTSGFSGPQAGIHPDPTLIVNRSGRSVVLRNVYVRHSGGYQRKSMGVLEGHINGFRYVCPRMEAIDVLYENVKHIFFQPVNNEMIVLIHLHLKGYIIINKKKIKDIQFYSESTISTTDDLDHRKNHRSAYDPDEILEEQKDRERRHKLNLDYKRFLELLPTPGSTLGGGPAAAATEGGSEGSAAPAAPKGPHLPPIEIPMKKLSFLGVPRNSSVLLSPTSRALVHLTEWPPFILTLEDVELVSLERVVHGLRHFDMIFIFKDYNRPVTPVYNIPTECLDMIKLWLNDINLVWYQGRNNLTWSNILKHIRAHIKDFVNEGGFASFMADEISERGGGEPGAKPTGKNSSDDEDEDEDDEEFVEDEEEGSGSSEDDDDEGDDDDAAGNEANSEDQDEDDDDDEDDEDEDDEDEDEDEDEDDEENEDDEEEDEDEEELGDEESGSKLRKRSAASPPSKLKVKKPRV